MTPLVPLMMWGWIPFTLWLFSRFKHRHAVIAGFALSWMFLPQYKYALAGLPNYTKVTAMSYSILLGTLIFNSEVFKRYKFHLLDLPVVLFCFSPFISSVVNGLGAYDGLSSVLNRTAPWGLPYIIGRLYFTERRHLAELGFGIFLGALIYVPFCLFEVAMSPNLHNMLYGFHPHTDFSQTKRGGGWRPQVFMEHGLMAAMWLVTGFLSGFQLLRSGWLHEQFPKWKFIWLPLLGLLGVTVVLAKSSGALLLMLLGIGLLYAVHFTRSSLPIWVVLLVPILYLLGRGSGVWDGHDLLEYASRMGDPDRVSSLATRLHHENILGDRAREQPIFGWGGWDRSFVRDEEGKIISVPDGFWILIFGYNGIFGLGSLFTLLLLPALLFLLKYPARQWRDPQVAAIAAMPLLMIIFAIDSLMNAMFNPLIVLLAGSLTSLWLLGGQETRSSSPLAQPPPQRPATRLF